MFVNRNPFAREEIHKEPILGRCDFCGNQNKYKKVWKYHAESDAGRTNEIKGIFCSLGCLNNYHN